MKRKPLFVFYLFVLGGLAYCESPGQQTIATFSIVAYDSLAEEWGVAVQSRFLAVGAVVPYARAGAGAVASQAWGNPNYGPRALELLSQGFSADSALKTILSADSNREYRQVGIVDKQGNVATFTGKLCQSWAGGIAGTNYCVQGNILAGDSVIKGMAAAFEGSSGPLSHRLIAALDGGQTFGGDKRGMQSTALLVVSKDGGYSGYNDRMVDLRVDDHAEPIKELDRLLALHEKTFGAGAYIRIGLAAKKEGKREKAELLLTQAMAIAEQNNDDPQLLNSIAWEFAISGYRLPDALRMAEKAVTLAPGDATILDTQAECYARLGDYKKAVEIERRALAKTKNPEFEHKIKSWNRERAKAYRP
jgi:uncharacterized Ntn-hydrolase superfamily protein